MARAKTSPSNRSALFVSILSLCVATGSFTFSAFTYFAKQKYDRLEYDPHLALSNETADYTHPQLLVRDSPELEYLAKHGVAPPWFSYRAKLENVGDHSVTIAALYMCFRRPMEKGCPNSSTLGESIVIRRDTPVELKYEPRESDGLPVSNAPDLEILVRAEVVFPGDEVKIWDRKVGGFHDGKPLLVREGTIVPEGSAMAVELHFTQPRP